MDASAALTITPTTQLGYRPMAETDLDISFGWLSTPEVRQWYHKQDRTREAWDAEHLARIRGQVPTRPFILTLDGQPVGYIQAFFIADWPDYAARVPEAPPSAVAMDIYIGRPDALHRGLGSRFLDLFVRTYVFPVMQATVCLIGPEPQNTGAIRAYQKAGFRFWQINYDHDCHEFEFWMRRHPDCGGLRQAA